MLLLLLTNLVADHFEETANFSVKFANARDFLKDVTKLLVEEQNLLLQKFVLACGRHLTNSCKEDVYVTCRARLNEISEQRCWHVSLLYHFCIDQRRWG